MNIDPYTFSSAMKKHPYTKTFILTAAVYAVVDVIVEAIGMIVYFTDPKNYFSLPSTAWEIFELVLQYIYILLFAAIGFVIMVIIGLLAQRLKNSGKNKAALLREQKA
jgi:preprotein translocase subunit Sss1